MCIQKKPSCHKFKAYTYLYNWKECTYTYVRTYVCLFKYWNVLRRRSFKWDDLPHLHIPRTHVCYLINKTNCTRTFYFLDKCLKTIQLLVFLCCLDLCWEFICTLSNQDIQFSLNDLDAIPHFKSVPFLVRRRKYALQHTENKRLSSYKSNFFELDEPRLSFTEKEQTSNMKTNQKLQLVSLSIFILTLVHI